MAGRSGRREHKKGRLEAFSDGVFAIAITLLVLDIVVPHVAGRSCSARSGTSAR